jgi:hypothetical protein
LEVGEVAAPATGDENFFAQTVSMFEDGYAAPPLARFDGAHQSGGTSAKDYGIEGVSHGRRMKSDPVVKIVRHI